MLSINEPANDFVWITESDAGREIDFRDRQFKTAESPISLSFEPDSNVNDER
jgi:hypothetical protein